MVRTRQAYVVCVLTLVTNEPDAAEPVNVALEFRAPPGCSDRETFAAGLRNRSNRIQIVESNEPAMQVSVRLTPSDHGVHGELRLIDDRRESELRAVDGVDCAEVVEALSLTAALAIERTVALDATDSATASGSLPRATSASGGEVGAKSGDRRSASNPEAPATFQPKTETEMAPHSDRDAESPVETERHTTQLHVLASASERISSHTSIGLSLTLLQSFHVASGFSPEIGLGGIYIPGDALQPSNRLRMAYVGVVIQGCPVVWSWTSTLSISPCAVFEIGSLTVTDRTVDVSFPSERSIVTIGGLGRMKWRLTRHVALGWELALMDPLPSRRYSADLPSIEVGRTAPIVWQTGLGWLFGW